MSILENKLESEMIKMSKMVRDTISGLTEQINRNLYEVDIFVPTMHYSCHLPEAEGEVGYP